MPVPVYLALIGILSLSLVGGGVFGYQEYTRLTSELEQASSTITSLSLEIQNTVKDKNELASLYTTEKARNDAFDDTIQDIAGTVGVLDKLAKTDPELLQKYSKVYFLNENYVPAALTQIDPEFASPPDKVLEIHRDVWPHLEDLLEEAKDDGIDLAVTSAFRSFGAQGSLKSSYAVHYGSGANTFSADQGYSEHQLGTTVDFTTGEIGGGFAGFEATETYAWLLKNAHRFGFVLSYPKDNTYYIFEPWHWRYVGEKLARDLEKSEKHFYDLDQRDIDAYLVDLFE